MIDAAIVAILGLAAGAALAHQTGLRLSGVVVVPLLAIYTLVSVSAFVLFLVSAAVAIAAVGTLRERTLLHGRALLLASLGVGAIVPVLGTLATGLLSFPIELTFLGTVLPGLAAFNYHQLEPAARVRDLTASAGVFVGLVAVGTVLMVSPLGGTWLSSPDVHGPAEVVTTAVTLADGDGDASAGGIE